MVAVVVVVVEMVVGGDGCITCHGMHTHAAGSPPSFADRDMTYDDRAPTTRCLATGVHTLFKQRLPHDHAERLPSPSAGTPGPSAHDMATPHLVLSGGAAA